MRKSTPHDMFAGSHPESDREPVPDILEEAMTGEVVNVEPSEVTTPKGTDLAEQVIDHNAAVLDMIVRAATDPAVDVEKMERLMTMHERIATRAAETAFNDAMAKAQAQMKCVAADLDNKQTRSKYASYAGIDRMVRPIYAEHGFSLSFDTDDSPKEGHIRVLCYASHEGGFTRTYKADMPADGKGAKGGDVMTKTHAAGSAFTYGQRYLVKMIFNIAIGEDDDGNAAGGGDAINDEQKQTIIDNLKEIGGGAAETAKFLAYMEAASVDQIRSDDYLKAVSALAGRKAQLKENA